MPVGNELEMLRELLSDNAIHIAIGKITGLELASDRSVLRVKVAMLPENREVVARMTWEQVGPESGIFGFPVVGDLVLLAIAEADINQIFVIKRMTSKEDKIPLQAVDGSTVIRALAGKKTHVISDEAILLGRGGETDPDEPLVLGNVFAEAYSSDLQATAQHKHIGNLGYYTTVPDNASTFVSLKASPVDDEEMLSDISMTEK
jgi:hypothetical protein